MESDYDKVVFDFEVSKKDIKTINATMVTTKPTVAQIKIGSVVEMRNAYQSFFYKVLDIPQNLNSDRFKVLTEAGARYHRVEDFYSVSDNFDFNKIGINSDNLHLYYSSMDKNDLYTHRSKVVPLLTDRYFQVFKLLNIDIDDEKISEYIDNSFVKNETMDDFIIAQSFFEVKDTLQPIDDFIDEIQRSDKYREYAILRQIDEFWDRDDINIAHNISDELMVSFTSKHEKYRAMDIYPINDKKKESIAKDLIEKLEDGYDFIEDDRWCSRYVARDLIPEIIEAIKTAKSEIKEEQLHTSESFMVDDSLDNQTNSIARQRR